MKICMQKQKNGERHTNRTDNSVSVCIPSTDGQAALRKNMKMFFPPSKTGILQISEVFLIFAIANKLFTPYRNYVIIKNCVRQV